MASSVPEAMRVQGSRAIARMRYEDQATAGELLLATYEAIMRFISEGRIPLNIGRDALVLAEADIEDRLSDESFSWCENPELAKTHGGDRGVMFD